VAADGREKDEEGDQPFERRAALEEEISLAGNGER
jgi:hypothetical protein